MSRKNKPPHNIPAEKALLGRVLKYPKSYSVIEDTLQPEYFYEKRHELIFQACMDIHQANRMIDVVAVHEQLKDKQDEAGGMVYLESLAEDATTEDNILAYVDIIKSKYFFRNTITGASELLEHAYSEDELSLDKSIDELESKIRLLSSRKGKLEQLHIKSHITDVLSLLSSSSDLFGITTGLHSLDEMICGFNNKNLIILAARPSVGKTALALNMALAAIRAKKKVGFISLEMSGSELALRLLSMTSHVNSYHFKTAKISESDWNEITKAAGYLASQPLYIEDSSGLSSFDIRSLAREIQRTKGLDILFIDYLQLIREKGKRENKNIEVSDISNSLKGLAKELDIPVVALSQLSRNVERREDKEPMLSDLRDSGSIEQDADVVLFLHRESLYDKEADLDTAKLIVAKYRNGAIGSVDLKFTRDLMLFEDSNHRYS